MYFTSFYGDTLTWEVSFPLGLLRSVCMLVCLRFSLFSCIRFAFVRNIISKTYTQYILGCLFCAAADMLRYTLLPADGAAVHLSELRTRHEGSLAVVRRAQWLRSSQSQVSEATLG